MPAAGALPSFIRNAHWSAYVAGALALVLGMLVAIARRKRAAERRVRTTLAAASVAPADWTDGAEVTVRGALRAERAVVSVAVLGFARGGELTEIAPASSEAAIEVESDAQMLRVELGGAIAVTVGSHVIRHPAIPVDHFEAATVARDRVRRSMQLGMWPSGIDAFHVRKLAPDEQIIARGRLARSADGAGWRLVPLSATRSVEVAAVRGVVDPVPLPPLGALARSTLVGLVLFLAIALATDH